MVCLRNENEVPTGQGDLAGESGPFGTDGVLADLDHDLLAFLQQILNVVPRGGSGIRSDLISDVGQTGGFQVRGAPLEFRWWHGDIVNVEEAGAFQANIDKGGLHAGQYSHHPAEINIAHEAFLGGALEMEFGEIAVFDKRDPYFISPRIY
ncbi:hypothetical protein DPPLL_15010 [Desulfofustis limnaeus]|uniref:Uncharacterized protein n=1 Tax=Desulfofustis limnaeus TaxID=2740163 RepID=A0ABN6M2N7_9BACT|nr:hypothetical protein DPPLL_15010 [Desulfofustis limnaeus]